MSALAETVQWSTLPLRPYGERGYLLGDLSVAARLVVERALALAPPVDFEESVPGTHNLLLLFRCPIERQVLEEWLCALNAGTVASVAQSHCVEVPVVYDGPDLAAVAQATGLSEAEVVAIHSAPLYQVRMMGFAPGFPYLDGLDHRLHFERKASPRNRIEPGSVAIGGSHAGIYSVASPGGWHLLGRTSLPLFCPDAARGNDIEARDVFTLAPGDTVKFIVSDDGND